MYVDNCEEFEVVDRWKDQEGAHRDMGRPWVGSTTFTTTGEVPAVGVRGTQAEYGGDKDDGQVCGARGARTSTTTTTRDYDDVTATVPASVLAIWAMGRLGRLI